MSIFRTKTIEQSIAETDEAEYQLKKRLTALDLTVFGIGVIIGAGIFTLTGRAAKRRTPARRSSSPSCIAAVCCGLAALCYAEFASTVPVAGLGVHVLLRHPRRARRLDHRLGPAARADARRERRRPGLEPVRRAVPRAARHRPGPAAHRRPAAASTCWPSCSSRCSTVLVAIGIKESMRVNLGAGRRQAVHRAVRDRRRHRLRQRRQLHARSSRRRSPAQRRRAA